MGASESKEETSKITKFALVGSSGSGKSAFVNAVRSINSEDRQAARVDIVEEKREQKEYIHPKYPLISFYDFPGYGTRNYPRVETYWNNFKLEKFGIFLIFISLRVTSLDLDMIKKAKNAKKDIFIVRTKIDIEYTLEKDKEHFNEIAVMIRNYVFRETEVEQIFLISNYRPDEWEFLKLIHAVERILPVSEKGIWENFFAKSMAKFSDAFKDNAIEAAEKLIEDLDQWKEVKISVAVVGKNGCGKSSFINAIRGVEDDDENAAKTDVVETTKSPVKYSHPNIPNIILADCPGIGSNDISDVEAFCRDIKIQEYDACIIMTSERFEKVTEALAEKLKSIKKPFFLTRTKIDNDIKVNEERRRIPEETTLESIRRDCSDSLTSAKAPLDDDDIFLISNHRPGKWDFAALRTAIKDRLPTRVREVFLLPIVAFSENILKQKVENLKDRIKKIAAKQVLSSFASAHYSLIIEEVKFYRAGLGFPEKPGGREAIEKFYLKPDSNVEHWLREFDHCGYNSEEKLYTFLCRALNNVLDEMGKAVLEHVDKTVRKGIYQA
ncbi:interferon-inducible GTPase 5-like [Dendronephthya gigantea]|uniref:interferon-inducible GTPase 5-like n=1 Tax=Dendronephthya gigantea TaxID=151771 RepID=UPI00106A7729|nr:interferon-inducible GTPase 5-like [Dendronephthya gigantea]